MNQITNTVNHFFRVGYSSFDRMTGNMTPAHWGFFAVIIIATAVILMRGKPVHGA